MAQAPQQPVFCATCPDEPAAAVFYCASCSGLPLCLGCKNKHLIRMKGHMAIPVENSKDIVCPKHPDKCVEFCCYAPCHDLVCYACALLDHDGHKFCSLPDAASRERVKLQRVADEAIENAALSVDVVTALLDELLAYVDGLHGSLAVEGEKLVKLIQQKIVEAHVAIDIKMAPKLQYLEKAKNLARETAGKLRSCAAVSSRLCDPKSCSDTELYRLAPVSC